MQHWIDRSAIAHRPMLTPYSGPHSASATVLLLRCRRPPLSRQNDRALIVSATLYETGLLSVADRLVERQTRKTDIATDALGSPPGMRGLGTKAVELGDERRRALKTVLVAHQLMAPQRHGACQQ